MQVAAASLEHAIRCRVHEGDYTGALERSQRAIELLQREVML